MKIALVSEYCLKRGGISRYAAELAERLSKTNEVHVFTKKTGDFDERSLRIHRIPGVELHPKSPLYIFGWLHFMIKSTFGMNPPEFEIVNSQMTCHLKSDVVTAQSCHKAYFYNVERHRGLKSLLDPSHWLVIFFEGYVYRNKKYRRIIAISNRIKEEIVRYHGVSPQDIEVIHSGVNTVDFAPRPMIRRKMRERLGISKEETVFLFVAHEFKRKGLEKILRALAGIDGKLVVVGSDSKKEYDALIVELGLDGRVMFAMPSKQVQKYYNLADIFVFPTIYEPFGLVITEAMASGLPVIVSKLAGAAEIITDGKDGCLIKNPRDVKELAEKMHTLAENKELRKKIGLAARSTAKRYSWDYVTKKTMRTYEQVLKEKKNGYSGKCEKSR